VDGRTQSYAYNRNRAYGPSLKDWCQGVQLVVGISSLRGWKSRSEMCRTARASRRLESESSESQESAAGGASAGGRLRADAIVPVRACIATVAVSRADRVQRVCAIKGRLPSPFFRCGVCCGCSAHSSWYGSVHHAVGSSGAGGEHERSLANGRLSAASKVPLPKLT
jgi:hypothetical protein